MSTAYATLLTWLDEARAARQALAVGTKVKEFWREGRKVIRSEMTAQELDTYIATLTQEIANHPDNPDVATTRRRPVRMAMWR
jgi:hypothetical protein